jgi:shikimate kinase
VQTIGAVNTLVRREQTFHSFNTDYNGVKDSLQKVFTTSTPIPCVVIGAGNAASSALCALKALPTTDISIINKNIDKSTLLAEKYNVKTRPFKSLPEAIQEATLIVSTVPSHTIAFESNWFHEHHIIFDANYNQSVLSTIAQKKGIRFISGIEWLKNQAIPSYRAFLGKEITYDTLKVPQKNYTNLLLIGFMGSGKTSVGKQLAEHMNMPFLDLDEVIMAKSGLDIPEFFAQRGEQEFRNFETEILREVSEYRGYIIATGGGITERTGNRSLLQNMFTVYLHSPFATCMERIQHSDRPLLTKGTHELQNLYNDRQDKYFYFSDYIINQYSLHSTVTTVLHDINQASLFGRHNESTRL